MTKALQFISGSMEAAAAGLDPGQTRPADPATSENEDGAIKKTFDWVGSDEPRRFLIINQGSEKGPLADSPF